MAKAPTRAMWRKAARLLYQRRVRILSFGRDTCVARVEGDSATYEVALERGEYTCQCALKDFRPSWMCSHCAAVYLAWSAVKSAKC